MRGFRGGDIRKDARKYFSGERNGPRGKVSQLRRLGACTKRIVVDDAIGKPLYGGRPLRDVVESTVSDAP